jgi:protein-S-isoprenylcysteine O-methyltransferase Ste14
MFSLWWIRVLLIVLPFTLEQLAYWHYVSKPLRTKPGIRRVADPGYITYIWDITLFLVLLTALYNAYQNPFSMAESIGLLVYLSGIALRILSLRELGGLYFNGLVIWENHRIIQTGPYRIFRHPLHIGTNLQITGLALFAPFWLGGLAVVAALLVTYFRNRREDQFLLQEMAEEYQMYYQKAWDLIDLLGK